MSPVCLCWFGYQELQTRGLLRNKKPEKKSINVFCRNVVKMLEIYVVYNLVVIFLVQDLMEASDALRRIC
tara:strand:- start:87736 stop:87945 length:210 start_codon:yes stop_codon:yes gene_type:complete